MALGDDLAIRPGEMSFEAFIRGALAGNLRHGGWVVRNILMEVGRQRWYRLEAAAEIADKAVAEGRALTPDERSQINIFFEEVDQLTPVMATLIENRNRELECPMMEPRVAFLDGAFR